MNIKMRKCFIISVLLQFVTTGRTWLVCPCNPSMVTSVPPTAVTTLRLVLQAPSLSSYSTHFLLDCLKLLMTFLFSTSLNSFMHQRARPMVLRSNLQYSASSQRCVGGDELICSLWVLVIMDSNFGAVNWHDFLTDDFYFFNLTMKISVEIF